jgi:hypothetical protein
MISIMSMIRIKNKISKIQRIRELTWKDRMKIGGVKAKKRSKEKSQVKIRMNSFKGLKEEG